MLESIEQVLVRRDGITPEAAKRRIQAAKRELLKRAKDDCDVFTAGAICRERFHLEPDYAWDLID